MSHWPLAIPLLAVLLLSACLASRDNAPAPPPDRAALLAHLANPATPTNSRLAADGKLLALTNAPSDDARLAILEQIVWAPQQPEEMRIYALDQIAAADRNRAGRVLVHHLPRMEEWPVLQHACDLAVSLGDLRTADALACSLDRPAKTYARRDRPEAKALVDLTGKTLEDALADRFLNATDASARIAAMDVLAELKGPALVKKHLAGARAGDRFAADLQWWLARFDTLPVGEQETDWVQHLARNPDDPILAAAVRAHAALRNEKDYTFAPRFLVTLTAIDAAGRAAITRDELIGDLRTRLNALPHAHREPQYPGAADDVKNDLDANLTRLSRCDLWNLRLLLAALQDAAFRKAIHAAGLADMSDTTTEHGGLLTLSGAAITLTEYPPLYTGNDHAYASSDKLLRDLPLSLAAYHFHFQQVDNASKSGPGTGDLDFVRNTRCNGVVFTSTSKAHFNASYYTPGGAVIDLGVYTAD